MNTYEIKLQHFHTGTKNVTNTTRLERAHTAADALTQVRTNIVEQALTNVRITIESIKPYEGKTLEQYAEDLLGAEGEDGREAFLVEGPGAYLFEMLQTLDSRLNIDVSTGCSNQEYAQRVIKRVDELSKRGNVSERMLVDQLRKDFEYYKKMMYQCANEKREVDESHHAGRMKEAGSILEFLGEEKPPE